MRNRVFDALLYVFVFILVQFLVTYAVIFVWMMADGKSMQAALGALSQESLTLTAPMLIVTQAVYSLVLLVLFVSLRWCRVSRSYLRS